MSRGRELAKKLLPQRFVNWYRRRRVSILTAAGGATRITPGMVVRHGWRKTAGIRAFFRRGLTRVLPKSLVDRIRRRRVMKQYLKALSFELLERETRLDYIEGRVAARRDGFYERIVKDVLERTEIILQELDRRIEGLSARSGERMNAVEEQLLQLRDEIGRLRQLSEPDLRHVSDRARAEVPEVPSAEGGDEPRREDDDRDSSGSDRSPSGNGRIHSGAPAATTAE